MLTIDTYSFSVRVQLMKEVDYYLSKLSQIRCRYDDKAKGYLFAKEDLDKLESLFPGEIYYKVPKWKILGLPMPEVETKLLKVYETPKFKDGLTPFKYQEYGYQFIRNKMDAIGFCFLTDSVGLGSCV